MADNSSLTTVHSLIHAAEPAMCSMDWSLMTGDDNVRTCPQCGETSYRVDRMEPAVFCSEADRLRLTKRPLRTYRRLDGAYMFSNRNCSPKKMFAPLRADLRGVVISNWWSDRYGRYNLYLALYGLVVGGVATFELACSPLGAMALCIFIGAALISAIAANLLFGACVLVNLAVPGFLAPVRRFAGPVLLGICMLGIGWHMTTPLILINGGILMSAFPFPGLQG